MNQRVSKSSMPSSCDRLKKKKSNRRSFDFAQDDSVCCSSSAIGPAPIFNLWQVVAILGNVQVVALNLLGVPLPRVIHLCGKPGNARDRVKRQLEAVDVVEHAHIEGSGGCA